jgi:hypothetical protein
LKAAVRSVLCILVAGYVAVVAGPAAAAEPLELDPNGAGEGARLEIDVDPRGASGEGAQSLSLALPRGLRFDRRAVSDLCLPGQAAAANCPEGSSIGRGHTEVTFSGYLEPDDSVDVISRIDAYLAPAAEPGDAAGMVLQLTELVSKQRTYFSGRIVPLDSGPYGYELRVDSLPTGQPPPPVTATFKRLRLFLQARRKVVKRKKVRGRRVKKRVRYHLFRNPKSCGGTWRYELRVRFASGQERRPGSAPCSRG